MTQKSKREINITLKWQMIGLLLMVSFMIQPWLEADIRQQTADCLSIPVQLIFYGVAEMKKIT